MMALQARRRDSIADAPATPTFGKLDAYPMGQNDNGVNTMQHLDDSTRTELEAAAFRRLLRHLDEHKEVQNIDLMILADFCRNCLSKWLVAAAEERGETVNYEAAREYVYGMPYGEWKAKYQADATPEQQAAFEARQQQKAAAKQDADS